jgi:hypothetical protein
MEFGVINQAEINLTTYQPDPQAEAVVLFDIGDSRFIDKLNGYDIQFTRIRRIKILSRAGIKYSEISIPVYNDNGKSETVTSIEAFSYNYNNGKLEKTPLDQISVYNEKINNNWNVKKFAMPDIRQGTIIEYKYILESPFHFNLPDWEFQDRIPTVYSKYTVRMIPFYEYAFIVQGITKFDSQESHADKEKRSFGSVNELYGKNVGSGFEFQDMIHTYIMRNVPAFKDESYITSVSDYIMKMDFQLAKFYSPEGRSTEVISTWPLLIQEMLKADNFGKYQNSCERLAKNILEKELSITNKSEVEKCQAIINYVKSKYTWDGFSDKFTTKSPKDFINQKKGNPAEINLFMTALLNAAGITANPVVLSTRDHGKINLNYPFIDFFNYVVVLIKMDNQVSLADGAEFFTQYNRIPPKCINEKGLIISKEGENWISLDLQYNSIDQKTINLKIDPVTFNMTSSLIIQASEYDSYWYKKKFSNDTVKIKEYLLDKGIEKVLKISTMNYDQAEKPYIISCNGISEVERLDNKIIVSPFLKFAKQTNELTQSTRTYPVDFTYSRAEVYKTNVQIPSGYKVMTLPGPQNIDNDLVEIKLEYKEANGIISIEGSFKFKKAVYAPTEYTRLRDYINTIIKKFNEPLVLEKT